MYFVKTPFWMKWAMPGALWNIRPEKNEIYLTFDDGPNAEITSWVLDFLKKKNSTATFFCGGANAVKHPELILRMISEGHEVGSHGYDHLNGWSTDKETWMKDIKLGNETIEKITGKKLKYFRPPFGKMKPGWIKEFYSVQQVVMWDVLSGDFDETLNPAKVADQTFSVLAPGSILCLHDSEKAFPRMKKILEDERLLKFELRALRD